jgi:phosphate transport system substrate-binding protein
MKRMASRRLCSVVASLVLTTTVAAAQELTVVGTGDGIDLLRALGLAFTAENRSIRINVPSSVGSDGGIDAVTSGQAVLGRVARILTDAESAAGVRYEPIARLSSAFYVHRSTGVTSLTTTQLADVYAGRVQNWNEVGGADIRIRVVRREDTDSTLRILRTTMPRWNDLVITDRAKTALTTQDAVETVRDIPGTIGFGPFTKTLEMRVVVLRVDGHYPTDVEYPSSVALALIYKDRTITAAARAFLSFLGSDRARELVTQFGALPMKKNRERS